MVTFDSAQPGTSAAAWDADGRLDALPRVSIDRFDRVLVVAAHPDDETLGAGGLIAECGRRGTPVTVVVVTDGAESHPRSTTTSRQRLRSLRVAEATEAVGRLAASAAVRLLGHPDGRVRENRDAIALELEAALAGPGTVLVVAPWRGDGHRDHRVLGEVCARLVDRDTASRTLLEYPIWMWHWADPSSVEVPWASLVALDAGRPVGAAKRHAIGAYASQTTRLSGLPGDEPVLRPDFVTHFESDREVYVSTPAPPADGDGPSLGRDYFEDIYARSDDPWRFTTRWYESRKRAVTLAALPERRYASALEIGASIGVLTEQLAARCDAVLALDVSPAAAELARRRLAGLGNAGVRVGDVAAEFPAGAFDLIVFSEVGYYLTAAALDGVLAAMLEHLGPDGTVVSCHWRHPVDGYLLGGDEVQAAVGAALTAGGRMTRLVHHDETDFTLDVYALDGRSVAQREGLA